MPLRGGPCGHDVLAHGHAAQDLGALERAHEAARVDPVGGEAVDPVASQSDLASVGAKRAGHDVEERRLARAVRADQREHLAGANVERHVVERLQPAEAHADAAYVEERGFTRHAVLLAGRRCRMHASRASSRPCNSPRGNKIMTITSRTP